MAGHWQCAHDTFRQGGEWLAGRYFSRRLHPFFVRELIEVQGVRALQAMARLMTRGGFPEPCLAATDLDADRWRVQYATDLVREDVTNFSGVHEVRSFASAKALQAVASMRNLAQHGRVGVTHADTWLATLAA